MAEKVEELFNQFLALSQMEQIELINMMQNHMEPFVENFEDDEFKDEEEDDETDGEEDDFV